MSKTIDEMNKETDSVSENQLMITIDNNGRIIKFNEICEKISGYSSNETLNKIFLDFIIPNRYSKQWTNIFQDIEEKKQIDDFKLPISTRNGHEIMISWSSFPVTDDHGDISNISLVGKLISSWDDIKASNIVESSISEKDVNEEFIKKSQELENKNKMLEEKIEKLEQKESGKFLSKLFGGKKNIDESENNLSEIEERKRSLKILENKLEKEKRSLTEQRNWFVKWREKLENLEYEVENRRQAAFIKEKSSEAKLTEEIVPETVKVDSIDLIDKIDDCAAIIQRGVIKKVNNSFADLLGYKIDEIVDKSLFDFIGPEGFLGLENYYLHRLKGEDITNYDTMFLTKDNTKTFVEVDTKPTIFNDDKAEIAVFKKIKSKKEK